MPFIPYMKILLKNPVAWYVTFGKRNDERKNQSLVAYEAEDKTPGA